MGTAQQEIPVAKKMSAEQILSVLEGVHVDACDLHQDHTTGITYDQALSKVFHELWTKLSCQVDSN